MLNRNGENCSEKWKGLSLIIWDQFVIVHQVQNCDIGGHFQNLLEQLCHRGSNICELKYFAKLPPGCSGRLTLIANIWLRKKLDCKKIFELKKYLIARKYLIEIFYQIAGCSGRSTLIDPSSAAIFPPSKLLTDVGKILLK